MADPTEGEHQHSSSCHRPLSRASRQLFREDTSPILLHYFGGKGRYAPWRRQILDTFIDTTVDRRGRRRERIPLVDNPADGLTDEEWYDLLAWAIDKSTSSTSDTETGTPICPLHPKHDAILQNDQNSFILERRHRTGVSKFGALSLPSGRAERKKFWLEEREMHRQQGHVPKKKSRQSGNSAFLFQCGICEKTFVSRFYLDKHIEAHHPPHNGTENVDSASNHLLCPADHVCGALGGTSACVQTMNQISSYYGRGTLMGKEYADPTSDSLFSSSLSSLISHFSHGGEDQTERADDIEDRAERADDIQFTPKNQQLQKQRALKEAGFVRVIGEMRHRALRRNKLMLKAALHLQQKQGENSIEEEPNASKFFNEALSEGESNFANDLHRTTYSSSCDEKEMERLFNLCRGMMRTCFGDSGANDAAHDTESNMNSGHTPNLTNDLIIQVCQPLHCHHHLHRMAGHNPRHVVHWNDQWDEHHSFAIGFFGWIAVLGVVLFYVCVFLSGVGDADFENKNNKNLPSYSRKKKKKYN